MSVEQAISDLWNAYSIPHHSLLENENNRLEVYHLCIEKGFSDAEARAIAYEESSNVEHSSEVSRKCDGLSAKLR